MPELNLNIIDGEPFFAHEMNVNFTPTQIILDFKCVTPRNDPRAKAPRASFQLKHNIVMLEPWHAKAILGVLQESVRKYEETFGKIAKPKSLQAAEKKHKALLKKQTKKKAQAIQTPSDTPTYLG